MKNSVKENIFDTIVFIVILLSVTVCLLPFIHEISLSFSSNEAVTARKVLLWPVGFNFDAYIKVFTDKAMLRSLFLTIKITVIFTALGMLLTICTAYPLTKMRLKGRKALSTIFIFTMYFSGGVIPDYLLINNLGLLNTEWSLILPLTFSAYNMIIMKNFFANIPESLEESARLDGCTDLGILTKIILPLSTPVLATIGLFLAVGRWNAYSDALYYITKPKLYPLQLKLNMLVNASQSTETLNDSTSSVTLAPEVLKAACIMFATVPILVVYPWVQKYFVKGVMVGAVKG
jgi:ABC-type sugar transport system, permease component